MITLRPDGTTTGALIVPAAANNGNAVTASMDGTFAQQGTLVTFEQSADTFVRDMQFIASDQALAGSGSFSGATIVIVLRRS